MRGFKSALKSFKTRLKQSNQYKVLKQKVKPVKLKICVKSELKKSFFVLKHLQRSNRLRSFMFQILKNMSRKKLGKTKKAAVGPSLSKFLTDKRRKVIFQLYRGYSTHSINLDVGKQNKDRVFLEKKFNGHDRFLNNKSCVPLNDNGEFNN